MYVTTNRIPVSKGFEAQFEERFTGRPSHMPGVPGFIRNYLLRPARRRARVCGDDNLGIERGVRSMDAQRIVYQEPQRTACAAGDVRRRHRARSVRGCTDD